jgi:alpha-amylase
LNRHFHSDLLSRPQISKDDLFDLYFDNSLNKHIFDRVSKKCYAPANRVIFNEIRRFQHERKQFKVSYGISGIFIEQCKRWNLNLLESFKQLAQTGCVEFLEETYHHSLASLFSIDRSEFVEQIQMHRQTMKDLFNYEPQVFENTECLYNNAIAETVARLGYKAIITEGAKRILDWRSPNYVYKAKASPISLLLRNYQLSDDIGFRFSSTWWKEWPLTAQKYSSWLAATQGQTITIFIDYETFGEHHWPESGIHEFLRWLPSEVLKYRHLYWRTPSEVVALHEPVEVVDVDEFNTVSWADLERDPSAWITNPMQIASYEFLKGLEPFVKGLREDLWLELWRYFQMSDHLYYMSLKGGGPGDVHSYFNPSGNPIDAFVSFSNIVSDFEARILQELRKPELAARWILRRLPVDRGFSFFYEFARPTGTKIQDLREFAESLKSAPIQTIQYHLERKDFERWLSQVLGDKKLAQNISSLTKEKVVDEKLRKNLAKTVSDRVRELESLTLQERGKR